MRRLLALLAFAAIASCNDGGLTDPGSVFGLELVVTPATDTLVAAFESGCSVSIGIAEHFHRVREEELATGHVVHRPTGAKTITIEIGPEAL